MFSRVPYLETELMKAKNSIFLQVFIYSVTHITFENVGKNTEGQIFVCSCLNHCSHQPYIFHLKLSRNIPLEDDRLNIYNSGLHNSLKKFFDKIINNVIITFNFIKNISFNSLTVRDFCSISEFTLFI